MKICYRSRPLHLLVEVLVLMLLLWSRVECASTSDCPDQYLYTQQPPQEIFVCNPYKSGLLKMSCSVIGQNITDIQWWFAPGSIDDNATQLTASSKYTLVPTDSAEGLEVQLTVNNLGDGDAGTYWCQAAVEDKHGVQLLSTSESVVLEDMDWFEANFILNRCMHVLKNSDIRCASILVTPPSATTTLPEPTLSSSIVYHSPSLSPSSSLYPSPLSVPETYAETIYTQLPTTQPASATPPSGLFQTSSVILYAVLGLVGFLAIACVILIAVVAMLCRRKCASRNMKGCPEKDAGFVSQFSCSQSSYPPAVYKHTESTHVIRTDTAHHRTMSGEYAEIGPALSASQGYSHTNILHSSLPPIPTEMDPESNQFQNPGYENPYDLLIFPAQTQAAAEADDVMPSKSQEKIQEGADSQNVKSHDYHMLEQIAPTTLESTTPVISPQHTYHTLENTAQSLVESDDEPDATASAYDDIIPREPSQRLSCDSTSELSRLPTIPENDMEDQGSVEYVNIVQPGPHYHPSDAVSPDLSTIADLKDCTGFSESSKDDGDYDRLVDPPHLYHVLEHSPSLPGCPRIHSFDMNTTTATYSHLEPGHCANEDIHVLLPHIHFVSQHADVKNASDSYSSESSLEATESNVFDDPQYLVGLPSQTRMVKSACSMRDKLKELQKTYGYAQQHGHPPTLVHRDKTEAHSDSILMKYSGDYERDPVYMQKLYNKSQRHSSHDESSTCTGISQHPLRVMDDSMWCDDSGFATYSSRRSSLPNLGKHIYQPLETETLEPVQPYDKLNKCKNEEPVVQN